MKQVCGLPVLTGLLIVAATLLSSCHPPGPTLAEALTASHFRMLEMGEAHQRYFRRNIQAGMTKQQVVNLAIRTSRTVTNGWYSDGQPETIGFNVVNNTTYEIWEYSYYSKIFELVFEGDRLVRFSEKPGVTVLDNM